MLELRTNPTVREQRQFVMIWLPALFAVLGGILYWRWHWSAAASVVWTVGAALTAAGIAIPPLRRPLFVGWMYAAYPIGWTISHAILIVTYYLVLTPIGLAMRLLGRDPLERRLDRSAATYWVRRVADRKPADYFRQY